MHGSMELSSSRIFSSVLSRRRIKSSALAFLASFKNARRPSRGYRTIGAHPLPTLYEINHPRMREIRREGDRRFGEPNGPLSRRRVIIAERMRDRSFVREADKRAPLCRASVARQFPIPLLARRTRDKEIAAIGSERQSVPREEAIVRGPRIFLARVPISREDREDLAPSTLSDRYL